MSDRKEKTKPLTTVRGEVAGFTAIQTPGTKYKSEEKEYQITVAFDPENPAVKEMLDDWNERLDAFFVQAKKDKPKLKNQLEKLEIGTEETDEDGDPTGRLLIKFRQNYIIPGKTGPVKKKIGLFDSRGKAITKTVRIGNGSIVRVSFDENPYINNKDKQVGFSFNRLKAVKLLKLVEYTGGMSAEGAGFDDDEDDDFEDGFDASAYTSDDGEDGDEDNGAAGSEDEF